MSHEMDGPAGSDHTARFRALARCALDDDDHAACLAAETKRSSASRNLAS
jgi:hypothetical protein